MDRRNRSRRQHQAADRRSVGYGARCVRGEEGASLRASDRATPERASRMSEHLVGGSPVGARHTGAFTRSAAADPASCLPGAALAV
jgi:hypothetical protein